MLLSLTTTHEPATDLGYLLAKHPGKIQSFPLAYGQAHVFYPAADPKRCTACLQLDIDPIALVRNRRGRNVIAGSLAQYVNDRPYVASSFLSVAIAQVLGTALRGTSKERTELAATPIPLEATLAVVPCRGGEGFLRALFEPLGYTVETERLPLDSTHPEWGPSSYHRLVLGHVIELSRLLTHLYVLLPVLDDHKHYWVGKDELDKLLARGEGWLAQHPEREAIVRRYLAHQRGLVSEALERLLAEDQLAPTMESSGERQEDGLERSLGLNEQRIATVVASLRQLGARQVIDLGCGEGRLLRALHAERQLTRIVGVDVAMRSLEIAKARLKLDWMAEAQAERIELFQGSLTYRDQRFSGFDAACLIEVIEHLDPDRLQALERVVFQFARPEAVIVTTPNVEYNVRFEGLPGGQFRHGDHRFEWSRADFAAWTRVLGENYGYAVRVEGIGPDDSALGSPTQMAVFSR